MIFLEVALLQANEKIHIFDSSSDLDHSPILIGSKLDQDSSSYFSPMNIQPVVFA